MDNNIRYGKVDINTKGTWTKRLPSTSIGNGTYEANIIFPEEGEYIITLTLSTLNRAGYRTEYEYTIVRKPS